MIGSTRTSTRNFSPFFGNPLSCKTCSAFIEGNWNHSSRGSVFAGALCKVTPKCCRKMGCTLKSACQSDFKNALVGVAKHSSASLHSLVLHVAMRCYSNRFAEHTGEMELTHRCFLGEDVKRQAFIQVCLYVLQNPHNATVRDLFLS